MSNSVSQSKRPRVELPATISMNPYEMYQQPTLYKNFYQDNAGGDRSIHVSAVIKNATGSTKTTNFDFLKVDTDNWPRTYDNRPHKCIYNLTQFAIYTESKNAINDSTINGRVFATNEAQFPFALATQIQNGSCNASTEVKNWTAASAFTDSEYPQIITTFKPINSEFTVKADTSGSTKFNFSQVSESYAPGVATFSGTYPAPSSLRFALIQLTSDPNSYMEVADDVVIFMQFLITLLD